MNSYHFIGIGGIGMSAIARILLQKNKKVKGSDIYSNKIIEELKHQGALIQIGHASEFVKSDDIIVFSSAINDDNPEYAKAKEMNLKVLHRSDLLNELMLEKKSLLVTGTHGKTTTTSLLTDVLIEGKLDPSFVIGGVLKEIF